MLVFMIELTTMHFNSLKNCINVIILYSSFHLSLDNDSSYIYLATYIEQDSAKEWRTKEFKKILDILNYFRHPCF